MTPDFNALEPATWPLVLTLAQVAAIYQRSVGGLRKATQRHAFLPAHYRVKPYRWRKSDVLRDIEGPRLLKRVG